MLIVFWYVTALWLCNSDHNVYIAFYQTKGNLDQQCTHKRKQTLADRFIYKP